jgi:hypothetical protein
MTTKIALRFLSALSLSILILAANAQTASPPGFLWQSRQLSRKGVSKEMEGTRRATKR